MEQLTRAPDGWLEMALHRGQERALESTKRFVLVLAGWQSGKTVVGPPWLLGEIKRCGPGDYLVASPTYPLMTKKVLPEFSRLFERQFRLGKYVGGARHCFTFSPSGCRRLFGYVPEDPVQVFFGHASDPNSLESATVKAAWLDEAGQADFRFASWEAILGRLSVSQGRVLLTTRPYNLGWLKQQLWDPWMAAGRNHPDIDVINFRSLDNPAFPREEYERARASMPPWRFRLYYEGLFERPAGMIYDAFEPGRNT
jgi:phage terminase large subunit-like protein